MTEVEGTIVQMTDKCLSNKHIDAILVNSNSVVKANGKATLPYEVYLAIPYVFHTITDDDGTHPREMRTEIRERMARLLKATSRHQVRLLGGYRGKNIISFPTKNNWREPEDLSLIEREAKRLVKGINKRGWKYVAMMRPVQDSSVWETFKDKFATILAGTECKVGVYSGIEAKPKPPKPETKKSLKDMTKKEKKQFYKERAAKAAKTRAANRRKKEAQAILDKQEARVKRQEAKITSQLAELN